MGLSPRSTKLKESFNHVRSSPRSDHKQPEVSRRNLLIGGGASAIAAAFSGPIAAMADTIDHGYGDNCAPGDASSLMVSPYGPTDR
jgi:H+/Cl- antiporter ClcA